MRFQKMIGLVVMCSVVGIAGAQGGKKPMMHPKPMMKTNWQAMYDNASKMMAAKDAKGLFSVCTPDFKMTEMGKSYNAKQSMDEMGKWFGMMKDMHATMKVTKVDEKGNMATVSSYGRMWGTTKPDPKTKKSHKYESTGTDNATWVRMNGKWMMKSLTTVNSKMMMDGKPFTPPAG